jgi:hypothetical protein
LLLSGRGAGREKISHAAVSAAAEQRGSAHCPFWVVGSFRLFRENSNFFKEPFDNLVYNHSIAKQSL